jgi:hypothetical protein
VKTIRPARYSVLAKAWYEEPISFVKTSLEKHEAPEPRYVAFETREVWAYSARDAAQAYLSDYRPAGAKSVKVLTVQPAECAR